MQLNKYPETSENQRKNAKIFLTSHDIYFGTRISFLMMTNMQALRANNVNISRYLFWQGKNISFLMMRNMQGLRANNVNISRYLF